MNSTPGKLSGKAAIVTGASSGIGVATALALAGEGAAVVLTARREERLQDVARRIRTAGGQAEVVVADVAKEAQAQEIVQRAMDAFGRIDILVNNAGLMLLGPVVGADTTDWQRMIDVNLLGLMYATHAALPHMQRQGEGHIVNISSVSGRGASPTSAGYSASKWAVGGFSEGLRQEVRLHGIRVTVIEPGVVATELTDHITHQATKSSYEERIKTMTPLEAEDIAAAVTYAVTQPKRVNVNQLLIRPLDQG
ncbi:SDR family oxidoreductase [Deinococcus peraridilitoris]|uniref:Short-chain alcohol dehydrogenase n=1 Tax=Deinococcus peraridilitoris (strain DSM 19664 / LMG 22246 / CIP 109416 / KR-200) TaxID=937777 RepID=L0A9E5_DEIPD|nr:SDR family oxidoreductase [Deinococcus peraridilitoris]AFZ69665.1 short-chain alcohol dehydrogenase [Deinococcus peraridilitoris DSM 19664]